MYVQISPLVLHQALKGIWLFSSLRFLGTKSTSGWEYLWVRVLRSRLVTQVIQIYQPTELTCYLRFLLLLDRRLWYKVAKAWIVKLLLRDLGSVLGVLSEDLCVWLLSELRLGSVLVHINGHIHTWKHVSLSWDLVGNRLEHWSLLLVLIELVLVIWIVALVEASVLLLSSRSKVKWI